MQLEKYLARDDRIVLPVGSTEQHGYLSLATDVIRSGHARYQTGSLDDQPIRIYAAPLPTVGGGRATGGAVIVASSTAQIDQTLHRLRALTLLAALAAAALAAPAALLATRRVLRPLAQLSADASVIGQTADPSRRLATTTSADRPVGMGALVVQVSVAGLYSSTTFGAAAPPMA